MIAQSRSELFATTGGQRYRGYKCYQWTWGFKRAIDRLSPRCFTTDVFSSIVRPLPAGTKRAPVHYFVRIRSLCSKDLAPTYFDDSSYKPGIFVHDDEPAPYGPSGNPMGEPELRDEGVIPQGLTGAKSVFQVRSNRVIHHHVHQSKFGSKEVKLWLHLPLTP